MDTISLNGETYKKTSVIAKELGYTSDYVGQLCREGEVACERVGRGWFVSEKSIREHKKSRHRSTKKKSVEAVREQKEEKSESENKQAVQHGYAGTRITQTYKEHSEAHYEADESELYPTLGSEKSEEVTENENEEENVQEEVTISVNKQIKSEDADELVHSDAERPKKDPVQAISEDWEEVEESTATGHDWYKKYADEEADALVTAPRYDDGNPEAVETNVQSRPVRKKTERPTHDQDSSWEVEDSKQTRKTSRGVKIALTVILVLVAVVVGGLFGLVAEREVTSSDVGWSFDTDFSKTEEVTKYIGI